MGSLQQQFFSESVENQTPRQTSPTLSSLDLAPQHTHLQQAFQPGDDPLLRPQGVLVPPRPPGLPLGLGQEPPLGHVRLLQLPEPPPELLGRQAGPVQLLQPPDQLGVAAGLQPVALGEAPGQLQELLAGEALGTLEGSVGRGGAWGRGEGGSAPAAGGRGVAVQEGPGLGEVLSQVGRAHLDDGVDQRKEGRKRKRV